MDSFMCELRAEIERRRLERLTVRENMNDVSWLSLDLSTLIEGDTKLDYSDEDLTRFISANRAQRVYGFQDSQMGSSVYSQSGNESESFKESSHCSSDFEYEADLSSYFGDTSSINLSFSDDRISFSDEMLNMPRTSTPVPRPGFENTYDNFEDPSDILSNYFGNISSVSELSDHSLSLDKEPLPRISQVVYDAEVCSLEQDFQDDFCIFSAFYH